MTIKIVNKLNNNILFDNKAKGFRYKVDGVGKKSVTTIIGNHQNKNGLLYWKRKMVLDGLKDVLLKKNEPIDKINTLIKEVVNRTEEMESYARDVGTNLHEWIDLYLKGKNPSLPEEKTLKRMVDMFKAWWEEEKFEVVVSELPLYSPKYDLAGCTDVIVTKKEWKGKNALLDWKSSKDFYVDQAIQVETYKRFIEETTDFKIHYLGIVNIPKDPNKQVSMMKLKMEDVYFKGFKASRFLENLESKFNKKVSKWKKENKQDV